MRQAEEAGFKFWFYVRLPNPEVSRNDLNRQMKFVRFYEPLNWIDRTFFGAKHPCTGMTLTLSGKPKYWLSTPEGEYPVWDDP
jgi:hypothetical protein